MQRRWVKSNSIQFLRVEFIIITFLETHLIVHTGDYLCQLCNIPFTKRALECHDRRFHADAQTNGLVEKALERNARAEVNYCFFINILTLFVR